jgi:hypothetical protein
VAVGEENQAESIVRLAPRLRLGAAGKPGSARIIQIEILMIPGGGCGLLAITPPAMASMIAW